MSTLLLNLNSINFKNEKTKTPKSIKKSLNKAFRL